MSILMRSAAVAFVGGLLAGPAFAQTVPVVYTEGQAGTGKAIYARVCETCHGDTLQGLIEAPPLAGPRFNMYWKGGPVKDLFDFVKQYMPQDKPTSLSDQEYADLVAYILFFNKVPTGDKPLEGPPPANMAIPK